MKIELKASCFFNWEFNLEQIDIQKAKEIITGDLISNMLETVKALDRRSEYFYEKFKEIESLYINKLAGVERSSYKSEINDNEEFWYKLLTKTNVNSFNFFLLFFNRKTKKSLILTSQNQHNFL